MPVSPNYAIVYPDGASQLVPLQSWFQNVALGVDAALTTALTGTVGAGTTAQRDVIFPAPATATDRVLLASKPARWFNTDKGYEQQYYAQYDDAGVTTTTPVKTTFGWGPSQHLGKIPISTFTCTGATKRGGVAYVTTAGSSIALDGVFSADFEGYEIIIEAPTSAGSGDIAFVYRIGGVDDASANYYYTRNEITNANTSVVNAVNGGTNFQIGRQTPAALRVVTELWKPWHSETKTMSSRSVDADRYQRFFGGYFPAAVARDGFKVIGAANFGVGTKVRVFGINDY